MILQIIILSYLMVNTFFAGYIFAGGAKFWNVILALLFGSFILLWAVVTGSLQFIYDKINNQFQIYFWFTYLLYPLTHGWKFNNEFDIEKLKKLNDFAIYKYSVRLINKRNNYTYLTVL
jgi:hypothetical protein